MKRVDNEVLNDVARSYRVVRHRADKAKQSIDQAKEGVNQLKKEIDLLNDDLDSLLAQADSLLGGDTDFTEEDIENADGLLGNIENKYVHETRYKYEKLETINAYGSWDTLMSEVMDYAKTNDITFSEDPFDDLLTPEEKRRIGEKILADYKVVMDPDERKKAFETYASYGLLFAAIGSGKTKDKTDEINQLCEKVSDLLHQYVNVDPQYNHNDFLNKPGNLCDWLLYFNKYYPDAVKGTWLPTDIVDEEESEDALVEAVYELSKRPTWMGMLFSLIYQFARKEEYPDIDKTLFIVIKSDSILLVGKTRRCQFIAGFINWLDTICNHSEEYHHKSGDDNDIRNLVMAILGKCGFGESDQEGIVKTIQDFAIDIYNSIHGNEEQINGEVIQISLCDFIMRFLAAVQNRAEGLSYTKAIAGVEESFVRRCQVVGYGMIDILKKSSTIIGKADVVSPIFRLVNSVDVDGWSEFTYQSLVRARTVYLGYYIDLEKMDEDLEKGWQELLDNGVVVSRRQV